MRLLERRSGRLHEFTNGIATEVQAPGRHQVPADRLIFELTEPEQITDRAHSFRTALDDFGSGFGGLSLLAHFQPDLVKIDMSLLRHLDTDTRRHAIVNGSAGICRALSIGVAEGVETVAELAALRALGVTLFQGYLFAKPGFETLPKVAF